MRRIKLNQLIYLASLVITLNLSGEKLPNDILAHKIIKENYLIDVLKLDESQNSIEFRQFVKLFNDCYPFVSGFCGNKKDVFEVSRMILSEFFSDKKTNNEILFINMDSFGSKKTLDSINDGRKKKKTLDELIEDQTDFMLNLFVENSYADPIPIYLKISKSGDFIKNDYFIEKFKDNIERIDIVIRNKEVLSFLKRFKNLEYLKLRIPEDFYELYKYDFKTKSVITILSDVLKGMTNMRRLNLSLNRFGKKGSAEEFVSFFEVLGEMTKIEFLNLSNNDMGTLEDVSIDEFSKALKKMTKLKSVNLSGNEIRENKAFEIYKALKTLTTLEIFKFSNNKIWSLIALNFFEILENNPNMQTLDLSSNFIKGKEAIAIAKILRGMPKLKSLDLSKNKIKENEEQEIRKIFQEKNDFD